MIIKRTKFKEWQTLREQKDQQIEDDRISGSDESWAKNLVKDYEEIAAELIPQETQISETFRFNQKRDVPLTQEDKENLEQLEIYKTTEWFIQSHTVSVGETFNDFIFEGFEDNSKTFKSEITVKCLTESYFCTLEKEEYVKCFRKMQVREENKMI